MNLNDFTVRGAVVSSDQLAGKRGSDSGAESLWAWSVLAASLGEATTAANSTGDTTLTIGADKRATAVELAITGSAGTRRIVLADTNAAAGALIALGLAMPATSGITVQVYSGSTSGTLLATVATDGTAGRVGILCARGASAWNEPVFGAWLD